MAAININTGDILYTEQIAGTYPSANFFSAIEPKDVIGVIGSKAAVEETSRVLQNRAHLQSLRVELERKQRRHRR